MGLVPEKSLGHNLHRHIDKQYTGPIILSVSTQPVSFEYYGTTFYNLVFGYGIFYNGVIDITATGGTGPYTYTLKNIPKFQYDGYFDNLGPGIYNFEIADANGNKVDTAITLTCKYPQPTLSIVNNINPSSCTGTDGSFTLIASGGTPPYSYSIDGGATFTSNGTFNNLHQGYYSFLLAKDANGFLASSGFNVPFTGNDFSCRCCPLVILSDFSEAVSCDDNRGIIHIGATGGTGPVSFSADGINYFAGSLVSVPNGGTEYIYSFSNFSPGTHLFFAKDGIGNISSSSLSVLKLCTISLGVNIIDATCAKADGSITVTGSSGTAPYVYSLDNVSYQADNYFSGLNSGHYTVWMKDAAGLLNYVVAVVRDNCPVVTGLPTSVFCSQKNGMISASGLNGVLPYSFSLDGLNFQSGNIFNGLQHGQYVLTIKDAKGSIGNTSVFVDSSCINISATVSNATCGNNNGSIEIQASGGNYPYSYSQDGLNFSLNPLFNNLAAGTITIYVKDATGMMNNTQIVVANSNAPQFLIETVPASCTNNDGQINIISTSNQNTLQFSLDSVNFTSENEFGKLSGGTYTILAKDINGCISSKRAFVDILNTVLVNAGLDTTVCEGTPAMLKATSNGNIFMWTPEVGLSSPSILNPLTTPVKTTTYTITAKDGACLSTDSVTIFVKPAPVASVFGDTTICFGNSAQLDGAGGLNYYWSPSDYLSNPQISNPFVQKPLHTMNYNLKITGSNGCSSINNAQVTIAVTPPPELFIGNDTSIAYNQSLQLQAVDINNSGFSKFSWSPQAGLNDPESSAPVATPTSDITYVLTAFAPGGCEGTASIKIKLYAGPNLYVPNAFTPNDDGHNDILKVIPIGIKTFRYLNIYNRWGQLIFHTSDPGRGWDGRFNGLQLSSEGFVWVAEGVDVNENIIQRKGTVLLIR